MKRVVASFYLLAFLMVAGLANGAAPEIYVYPDFLNLGKVCIGEAPPSYVIPDVVTGKGTKHFYLFNNGDADLVISKLEITATPWIRYNLDSLSFTYKVSCAAIINPEPQPMVGAFVPDGEIITIKPGGVCTVFVTFRPKKRDADGPPPEGAWYRANIEITSNDADEPLSIHRLFGLAIP
jgi:hypothetical protein